MTEVLGLITARGGSKGIPRKNVLPLAGKPLIAWTIEAARDSVTVGRTIVSTDDDEIADVCRNWGAEVPFMRPRELAQDDSPHLAAVLHALEWVETNEGSRPDYVLLLQPTSPLRTAEDIDAAVRLSEDKGADGVLGVSAVKAHPYQLREIAADGTLTEFIADSPPPGTSQTRRQAFPDVYSVNGAIYLMRGDVLVEEKTFQPRRTFPYVMPLSRSLQIDEPWDMHVANLILEDRHGSSVD